MILPIKETVIWVRKKHFDVSSRSVEDYEKNSSDPRLVLENLKLKNNIILVYWKSQY